eukprot:TRINITY_DN1035_c0_g1_i1.p1 TRINITY_DN1035_c0_g1~~TRINITY_DN1035_c0_g1_i1.p1  ORF type:complete len:226 (-),score=34.77 TRINITY_DN1035_c0_g1_i1:109-786(-)
MSQSKKKKTQSVRPEEEGEADHGRAYDYKFSVMLLGDINVGKSSIIQRYVTGAFPETLPTINVDSPAFEGPIFKVKGKRIQLKLHDTAGVERYGNITGNYYKGIHGIILVYDVTDQESYARLEQWKAELERYASKLLGLTVVSNKNDETAVVPASDGRQFCEANGGLNFLEVSAKNNQNVEEMFQTIASEMCVKVEETKKNAENRENQSNDVEVVLPKKNRCALF